VVLAERAGLGARVAWEAFEVERGLATSKERPVRTASQGPTVRTAWMAPSSFMNRPDRINDGPTGLSPRYEAISQQLTAAVYQFGLDGSITNRRFLLLAKTGLLAGAFARLPRRFSAINYDGLPFQWFLSLATDGSRRFGFLADVGEPRMTIAERIMATREALRELVGAGSLGDIRLDSTLNALLPPSAELEHTLMGLCVATDLLDQAAPIKVYANQSVGQRAERFRRFYHALEILGHSRAAAQIEATRDASPVDLTPLYASFDVSAEGIGRIKLYSRLHEAAPDQIGLIAEALGVSDAAHRLRLLHAVFMSGSSYPSAAVDICIELEPSRGTFGFKVDLDIMRLGLNEEVAHFALLELLSHLNLPSRPYINLRELVKAGLDPVTHHLLFVSMALRRGGEAVGAYFHPLGIKL